MHELDDVYFEGLDDYIDFGVDLPDAEILKRANAHNIRLGQHADEMIGLSGIEIQKYDKFKGILTPHEKRLYEIADLHQAALSDLHYNVNETLERIERDKINTQIGKMHKDFEINITQIGKEIVKIWNENKEMHKDFEKLQNENKEMRKDITVLKKEMNNMFKKKMAGGSRTTKRLKKNNNE
jgi:predicted RNase H-like nuclease (RuvC/YqgF family)